MTDRHHNIRKALAGALLCLFAFVYCGNALCLHTHTDAAGNTVTHSHPYLPSAQHSHSSTALDTINLLNAALQQLTAPTATAFTAYTHCTAVIRTEATCAVRSLNARHCQLRAPPCDCTLLAAPLAS